MCEFYIKRHCKFEKNGICGKYKSQDGLSLHCAGFWSKKKVEYFTYYAEMFSTGMKKKWPIRYYVDLFSGPGKNIIREDMEEIEGTCLKVINLRDKFTKYFFVDKNLTCINDLKKRIGKNLDVIFKNEDCNLAVNEIIKNISQTSLSLAIIDPDSLQFNFNNYAELSKRKIDLIVNYPIGPIGRAIASVCARKLESETLEKFHPGWSNIMVKNTWGHSEREKIKNLINDYIEKIKKLGYFSSIHITPFKNKKNTTLYYLIAFSKSKKGIEFWEKVNQGLKKKERQPSLL